MTSTMFKLKNVIQNYAWGSKTAITTLFGIKNSNNEPQAEIWMGAHVNGCSKNESTDQALIDIINADKVALLGEYTATRFGELPFLFKVLSAQTPLSIQVHPDLLKAQQGFALENKKGLAINDAKRNYKDPNHKPELVYALTHFKAMNGFRAIEQIIEFFNVIAISVLNKSLDEFKKSPNSDGLKMFFSAIMSLDNADKDRALEELFLKIEHSTNDPQMNAIFAYIKNFREHYPNDIGLFSPLLLNIVELEPGEAMYLSAQTPHAYVQGTALEIMANSDNVLRAGLTPKYIDLPELIDNTIFSPKPAESIKLLPLVKQDKLLYPVPVDDFAFEIVCVNNSSKQFMRSAEILFCIDGEVTAISEQEKVTFKKGESIFISNHVAKYELQGNAKIARAFN
ncbi:MAG: mannose-6-phosphate isomerase, class I [Vibrionaceae bacterium]